MDDTIFTPEQEPNKKRSKTNNKSKKSHKALCIVMTIIILISLAFAIFADVNGAHASISINFKRISDGKNPDGSPFNIYEIKNDEVLKLACEKLDNKITPQELKKHLSVTSNTSVGDLDAVKQAILDGQTTYGHNSSLYTLSYKIISDEIKAEGIESVIDSVFNAASYPSKTEILNAVAESYSEYYTNAYIVNDDVLNVDLTDIEKSDYYNQSALIKSVLNRMLRYFNARYDSDTKFVSEQSGVGFGDLQKQVANIINLDWENYNSYIIKNGVTKDRDYLLKQLTYLKNDYELDGKRCLSEYEAIMVGIEKYDPDVTKVVFIPALDSADDFYMNRTKVGIDYMIENANALKIDADTYQYNADYCAYLTDMFTQSDAPTQQELDKADAMRSDIIKKIQDICESALKLNQEYRLNESYSEIKLDKATGFDGIAFFGVNFIKTFINLSMLALFVYFTVGSIKKPKAGKNIF